MPAYCDAVDAISTGELTDGYSQRRILSAHAVDAFAAKENSTGLEALLIEVTSSVLGDFAEWPSCDGFRVAVRPVEKKGASRARVHLRLTTDLYREVFLVLCEDICSILEAATDAQEAITAAHGRLIRWQAFLKKYRPDGLTPEQQVGLVGELHVLQDVLLELAPAAACVAAWRGCKKAHQDFQFPGKALEVKATRAVTPERVSISNVRQLDDEGVEALVLTVVHMHSGESAGSTLPETVKAAREAMPVGARELLDEGLIEVGYLDVQAHLYEYTRYQVSEISYYEVGLGFPRLLQSHLPPGVKNVRYEISLDAAAPFLVGAERVVAIFGDEEQGVDR